MSKIIYLLLIVFIFHLSPFLPLALATQACNAAGITYSPTAFPPDPSELNFDFKINSVNVLNNLKGKEVQLRVTQRFGFDYESGWVTVSSDSFPITVGHQVFLGVNPLSPGTHTAVLYWKPDPKKEEELCSKIVYTVGDPNTCVLDPTLPSRIPPNTELIIKFSGKPKTKYHIYRPGAKALKDVTTDGNGQGEFRDVVLPGGHGDTVDLGIGIPDFFGNVKIYCSKKITIDLNTPQPGPPGTEPVPTAAPGTTTGPGGQPVKPAGPPTVAGGLPCGVGDSGIQTAIGCVHTSPAEFAKDVLKFAIGISGGLAFLMMLVGAFQMLTSAGNPDSLNAGKDRLTSAVIGLLFVIFATLFLQIIGFDILKLPGFGR